MTAPRKPVAWQYQDIDWGDDWAPISKSSYDNFVRGDVTGTRDVDWRVRELCESALDLQPLWALVEKWEAISKAHTSRLVREAHADFASELRATLEAMQ